MKTLKFIFGWGIITFLLLSSVVLVDLAVMLIKYLTSNMSATSTMYSVKDMFLGIASESLRALFLCYLFPKIKDAGTSFTHAIKFGIIISGLIATMWLIIGYGSFVLKNPNAFVFYDGIILLLQGILSGVGLQLFYKKQFIIP
jgi:hypothetical protein